MLQKLGLSKKSRHIELWSRLGQFQLSKVQPRQNLAEHLANTQTACGLHRLLPRLEMHTRPAEMVALPTVQAGEPAFVPCSSSFYIGMLCRAPAMEELCSEELLGKESEKHLDIPELDSALLSENRLQQDELAAAYSTDSFRQQSLQPDELEAAYLSNSFQHQSLQKKELSAAYATDELERTALTLSSLQQKGLAWLRAFKPASSMRASDDKLDAMTSSTRASQDQLQDDKRRASHNLFLSIFILMVSSLILPSLTLHSLSLSSSFRSDSFPNGWAHELAEQDELLTTFGEQELVKNELRRTGWEKEIEKHLELPNLLWDQELEKHLADKPFQLDQLQEYNPHQKQQDQLEKNNEWSIQLQQNLSENEKNKKKTKHLETKNEFHQSFEKMILTKLVALLLEKHFASATSFQLFGNKAWKKLREASKEIIFNKTMRGKELPHQLRREQLDCKELRSASFRALCPSNFEQNSFKEETFQEENFSESSFEDTSLTEETFTESTFQDSSFTEETFSETSFEESNLNKSSFTKSSLERKQLDKEQLHTEQLHKEQLHREHLPGRDLRRRDLPRRQL